ncbi:MAG: hypothetical protein M1827_003118 [Pycnora praestabilis]|nr:MAG: hypothetical protein M1827_003118 [Pycnora praestabilis]
MTTQTALALTEIGKPLKKISLPILEPQEHELLIKITVAGLNPMEQKIRDLGMLGFAERLPGVLAFDIVGTVVKTGPNVSGFAIGSHVFSQGILHYNAGGGLQEYTVVDARYSAIVPANITDLDAAVFPINVVTSALALFSPQGFGMPLPGTPESKDFDYKVQKIVIVGGGTNTGKLGVELARIAGIGTIIVIASLSGEAELKDLGATHVIARQAPDIEAQVRKLVGDELVYVYDTFTQDDGLLLAVSLLSNTKKGILARLVPGTPVNVEAAAKKAGFEEKQVFGSSAAIPEFGVAFWKQLRDWLESGDMKPLKYGVIEGLDAEKVNKVLDDYKTGNGQRWHMPARTASIQDRSWINAPSSIEHEVQIPEMSSKRFEYATGQESNANDVDGEEDVVEKKDEKEERATETGKERMGNGEHIKTDKMCGESFNLLGNGDCEFKKRGGN